MGDKIFKNRQEIVLTLVLGYYKLALPKTDSGSLAQLVEHFTFNEGVDGSNPSRATIFCFFFPKYVPIV